MKFGTYFAYWEKDWNADYAAYTKKVARLGFDVLEISAAPMPDMSDKELARIKASAEESNILISCCIGLPQRYNTASPDEATRRGGLEYLKKIIIAMQKIDSHILGGITYAYWPVDYNKPMDKDADWKQAVKSIREIADYAADHGVILTLETVNRFEQYLFNDAFEAVQFVKEVDKPNVKVMLDSFHMNIEEDNFGDAIRYTGKYLGHFHVGEANRKVPGKGHLPWKEMGKALNDIGYDGFVVMEPFVKKGGVIGKDIKVWRDLSDNADQEKMDNDIAESVRFLRAAFAPGVK